MALGIRASLVSAFLILGARSGLAQETPAPRYHNSIAICGGSAARAGVIGVVRDDSLGWPATWVLARLQETDCFTLSDGAGQLHLPAPKAGVYHLRIGGEGDPYITRTFEVTATPDGRLEPSEFLLGPVPCSPDTPSVRLTGVVRDDSTGAPLDLVNVQVTGTRCLVHTDTLGRWAIFGVPRRTLTISVQIIGYQSTDTVVSAQELSNTLPPMDIRLWSASRPPRRPPEDLSGVSLDSLVKRLRDTSQERSFGTSWELGHRGHTARSVAKQIANIAETDTSYLTRFNVVYTLGLLGPDACQAGRSLVSLATDPHSNVRQFALPTLESVGFDCFSESSRAAVVEALAPVVADTDAMLAREALDVLAVAGPPAVPVLVQVATSADTARAVWALRALGRQHATADVVAALMGALRSTHSTVAREAAEDLGGLGSSVRPWLNRLRTDAEPRVRAGGEVALKYLDYSLSVPYAGKCFRTSVGPWNRPIVSRDDSLQLLVPAYVKFSTAKRSGHLEDSSLTFRLEPTLGATEYWAGPGSWNPAGGRVSLGWSGGFSGLKATLDWDATAEHLVGTVRSFSDVMNDPGETAPLRLVRVRCR